MLFPLSIFPLYNSLFTSPARTEQLFLNRFTSCCHFCPTVSTLRFSAKLNSGQETSNDTKMVNSSPVQRHFDLWCCISISLLLFTFQSSQIAGPCILSRFHSCVVLWGRKGYTYFILPETGNSSVIQFSYVAFQITNVSFL